MCSLPVFRQRSDWQMELRKWSRSSSFLEHTLQELGLRLCPAGTIPALYRYWMHWRCMKLASLSLMLAAGCGSHERSPRALAVLSGASGAIIIATTLYRDSSYRRLRQLSSYEEVCFKCLAALVVHRHISIPSCTFSTTKFGHRKSAYHDCVLMLSMPPFIIGRRKCGIWAQRPWTSSEALSKAKSAKAVSLTPRSMELNTSSRLPKKGPWPDSSSKRTQPKTPPVHSSSVAGLPYHLGGHVLRCAHKKL